jgi:hypothetical protein
MNHSITQPQIMEQKEDIIGQMHFLKKEIGQMQ